MLHQNVNEDAKHLHKACPSKITTQAEMGANVWKPNITSKLRNSVYLEGILA